MGREYFVYVGTSSYTGQIAKNIYLCRFDPETVRLAFLGAAAETVNPGFLTISPNQRFLYAENEVKVFRGRDGGGVSSFLIDQSTGKLTLLNDVFLEGAGPACVTLDQTGRYLLVANYHSGSVAVFPVEEDGRLGKLSSLANASGSSVHPIRQKAPHPHSVYVSPDNRFVLAPDLGLDQVRVYRFDATKGTLTPNDPPFAKVSPGAGPRHLAFSPDHRFIYLLNELQSSISVFAYEASRGTLHLQETISALPEGFHDENFAAEIATARSGKFLYTSNRGHDSIAVFSIDPEKGKLTPVEYVPCGGKTPRHFKIDPTGSCLFVANQDSGNLALFRIHQQTGQLTRTDHVLEMADPVCIAFAAIQG